MSLEEEVVEFDFFQRISTQKGNYSLDFHKVTSNGVLLGYRIVMYAFNRKDMVVHLEKNSHDYVFTIDDSDFDDEMKVIILELLKGKL